MIDKVLEENGIFYVAIFNGSNAYLLDLPTISIVGYKNAAIFNG